MKTLYWVRLVVFVLLLGVFSFLQSAFAQNAPATTAPRYVPGEVLIQFKNGTTAAQQQNARARANAAPLERIRAASNGKGQLERAAVRGGQPVEAAIRALEADPAVAFAEPNWIYVHHETSTDPYYTNGSLWGMYGDALTPTNQYGSQANEAWATGKTGSKDIVIGIIDEGIDINHPDLKDNIWKNPKEIAGNGIDDDGNGYKDDVYGWDFANNDNTVYDGGNADKHGTHVAGTIGASANNSGVVGVNWNVSIISGKFLKQNGGTTANAIKAVDYFTNLKKSGVNVVATNNSWGGGGFSQGLLDAITRAANENILFIAAAGNNGSNNDSTASYPANYNTTAGAGYDSVIAVAAIDSRGGLASFSQYGATTVDLGAPGVGINSTLPGNSYASYNGTSMATPHVTGAVALYASVAGGSAADIRSALLSKTISTASLNGKCVTGGRLDVGGLIAGIAPPPLPTTGTISGTVTKAGTSSTVSGATISIDGTTHSATTGSDGKYAITGVEPGDYTVTASANGYDGAQAPAKSEAGKTTTADFALVRQTGNVSGTVTDAQTSSVIANATVALTADGTTQSGTTDINGAYTITGVPTGSHNVTASATGYTSLSKPVTVEHGATTTVDFALSASTATDNLYVWYIAWNPVKKGPNYDLQITVVIRRDSNSSAGADAGDEIVPNASVALKLDRAEGGSWTTSGTTNSSGQVTFTLSKAKFGDFTATVTGLTHTDYQWDSTLDVENPSYYTLSSTSGPAAITSAGLSSGTASAGSSTVQLSFASALDATSASDAARYAVAVNGQAVSIESAVYSAASNSVTLTLPQGALSKGDEVVVTWSNLLDAAGNSLSGQTTLSAAK